MGSGGARRKNRTWRELGWRYDDIFRLRFRALRMDPFSNRMRMLNIKMEKPIFEYWKAHEGVGAFLASRRDFEPDIGYGPAAWLYHWRKPKKYRYKTIDSRLCITTPTKKFPLYVDFAK